MADYNPNPSVPAFIELKTDKTGKRKSPIKIHKLSPTEEINSHKERFYQEVLLAAKKARVEKKYLRDYLYSCLWKLKKESDESGNKTQPGNP